MLYKARKMHSRHKMITNIVIQKVKRWNQNSCHGCNIIDYTYN